MRIARSESKAISIYIAPAAAAPMRSVETARAVAGRGLEGDRYASGAGTYSNDPGTGRDVTLIEIEALEALRRDYGLSLDPALSRRNIVTRGVALNHLVGREFRIGAALLRGERLCDPCMHMERLSVKGAMRALLHRGGLRATVIEEGVIKIGDPIAAR